MFTHIVLLKKQPWFLYADNEKEALKLCEKFKEDIAGVVSGRHLIVKHPQLQMTLEQTETLAIEAPKSLQEIINPETPKPEDASTELAEIEAMDDLEKELQDELDRHLPTQMD